MELIGNECLFDLKEQILTEEISYQFYEKTINSVRFIGPQRQLKEMMWEEFNHVRILREEYVKLGGTETITYKPEQHGGLAMPSEEIDTGVALDMGIKEEIESISRYEALSRKYEGHNISSLFNNLLGDEKKHLSTWEQAQIAYISARGRPFGDAKTYPTYRFTPTDLQVIEEAVRYMETSYAIFLSMVERLHNILSRDIVLCIVKEEKGHVELLEEEFLRLKGFALQRGEIPQDRQIPPSPSYLDTRGILDQIINGEKERLIRFYDWRRICTNSRLREVLLQIIEYEYLHLKRWSQIEDERR